MIIPKRLALQPTPRAHSITRRALLRAAVTAAAGATALRRARAENTVPVRVITSEFAPYSYSEAGQAEGIAVDRARALLRQARRTIPIEVYPWARAYETARQTPGALLFPIARVPEREHLFKWVGEAIPFKVALFRSSQRPDITPSTLEDAGRYRIGALLKDVKGVYLTSKNIPHEVIADEELGVRMLIHGRLDLLPSDVRSMEYRLNKLGLPQDSVVQALPLPDISHPLYFAFNRDTPDALVSEFRRALEALPRQEPY